MDAVQAVRVVLTHGMRQHTRAICLALALVGLGFAVLALVHVFGWADVPGGRLFLIASFPVLVAVELVRDLLRRSPAPASTTKRP